MKNHKNFTFGFIGAGNMGGAILEALISSNSVAPDQIIVYDKDMEKCRYYKKQHKVQIAGDNEEVLQQCDIVFLAVKPQIMEEVLSPLSPVFRSGQLIISIAAGIPLIYLKSFIRKGHILRAMPNTPCLVKAGYTALTTSDNLKKEEKKLVEKIFSQLGQYIWLEEKYFHIITGLSGSGPAYVFSFLEGLVEGAVKMGLNRTTAFEAAIQTIKGSILLLESSGKHPAQLKDMVTSPGGTTVYALEALHANKFHYAIIHALSAAVKQSEKMEDKLFENGKKTLTQRDDS